MLAVSLEILKIWVIKIYWIKHLILQTHFPGTNVLNIWDPFINMV